MKTEKITSARNERIRQVLELQEKSRTRRALGLFVVEGRRELEHCLEAGYELDSVFWCPEILPELPWLNYNLGNLYCLSSDFVKAIESYSRALSQYPYLGDAWFNRGLVQVYLKEREKGCMDLSRAGELGVADAYGIIKKFCEE